LPKKTWKELISNKKSTIPQEKYNLLWKKVTNANFWNLPSEVKRIGLDGAEWIVEVDIINYHEENFSVYRGSANHFLMPCPVACSRRFRISRTEENMDLGKNRNAFF